MSSYHLHPVGNIFAIAAMLGGLAPVRGQDLHVDVSHKNGLAYLRSESATPLALAFYWLAVHYGWPITYEDPALVYSGDIRDATDPEYRRSHPDAVALLPRGGLLQVSFPASADIASADPLQAAEAIIKAYNNSGLPGRFKVIQGGGMLHIVPDAVANNYGKVFPTTPILDTPVTIEPAVRSLKELLQAMATGVSQDSSQPIDLGTIPWNLLSQKKVDEGFERAPAREVLRSIVKSMGRKAVWNVLYDVTNRTFYVNIVFIDGL